MNLEFDHKKQTIVLCDGARVFGQMKTDSPLLYDGVTFHAKNNIGRMDIFKEWVPALRILLNKNLVQPETVMAMFMHYTHIMIEMIDPPIQSNVASIFNRNSELFPFPSRLRRLQDETPIYAIASDIRDDVRGRLLIYSENKTSLYGKEIDRACIYSLKVTSDISYEVIKP